MGLAGSEDKCKWLTEKAGFDVAINYRTVGNLQKAVKAACPKGVDVYFDNVGGDILDVALSQLTY